MAQAPQPAVIPEWTLGDRLRKAREHARLTQGELAADVGIARASVVNYETGRYQPSRPVLLSWAIRTGVSYEWLCGAGEGTVMAARTGFRTAPTSTLALAA